jgi:hypothetical protein
MFVTRKEKLKRISDLNQLGPLSHYGRHSPSIATPPPPFLVHKLHVSPWEWI